MPSQVDHTTPEADISAIENGTMDPLPAYVEDEAQDSNSGLTSLLETLAQWPSEGEQPSAEVVEEVLSTGQARLTASDKSLLPVRAWPKNEFGSIADDLIHAQRTIVEAFFVAISKEQDEVIALFINKGLVTANTTNQIGMTPLLQAVQTRNVRIVQELVDFDAEPDAYGVISSEYIWRYNYDSSVLRTPLQLAASLGHLPLVKLFLEVYHCDDSKIAPDGQLALRLAASAGHREVVDYLPSRRGGGWLRWKTQHYKAMARMRRAAHAIYRFVRFFVWDIEKFFLWTVPKHVIVKPLKRGTEWAWKNKGKFGGWCKRQVTETPKRVARAGKAIWRGLKKVPGKVASGAKKLWKWTVEELPKLLKRLGKYLWNLLTVRIPAAIATIAQYLWEGVKTVAQWMWEIVKKVTSFFATIVMAIATFFRGLTLRDIWNGFKDVLSAIFVEFPKLLWSWIKAAGDVSWKVLVALFGTLGMCIWGLVWLLWKLVTFVPVKIAEILMDMAKTIGNGWKEFMVWINPKAAV